MSDYISRQAAIDALDGEITITGRANATAVKGYVNLVKDRLERLPSAQPEIIRCKDCKLNPKYKWYGCPMPNLSEKQRPETAWCWKAERRTNE